MDNLFPDFHTFSIEDSGEARGRGGASSWDPMITCDRRSREAVLPGGRPPRRKKVEKEPPPLPRPAPNDKDSGFVLDEDSPLCEAQRYITFLATLSTVIESCIVFFRGIADPPQIVGPKVAREKKRQTKQEEQNELRVILNIHNRTPVSHEIFSHSQTTVHSIELKENDHCLRYVLSPSGWHLPPPLTAPLSLRLAGNLKPQSQLEAPESNVLPILLSTPVIATVNMSARQVRCCSLSCACSVTCLDDSQEIKAFHFNPGPIGMVVELKGSRVRVVVFAISAVI